TRLCDQNSRTGFELLGGEIHRELGRFHVLLRMERRQEKGFRRIIESLTAGAVGRKPLTDVHVEVEQVLNRSRILIAVQAAYPSGPGNNSTCASLRAQRCVDPL